MSIIPDNDQLSFEHDELAQWPTEAILPGCLADRLQSCLPFGGWGADRLG